jgi:serine/threonine protein kinase
MIFMGLKDGTVETLIESGEVKPMDIAYSVLEQMLRALDCLAYHDMLHRDVKPANILYTPQPDGQYLFQLTDFGLANFIDEAKTNNVGTYLFMAPEIIHQQGKQTPKVDVWSLYVTVLWTLNISNIRRQSGRFEALMAAQQAILLASKTKTVPLIHQIQEMAIPNPSKRACAARMIIKLFDGEGLTTPRDKVLPRTPQAGPKRAQKKFAAAAKRHPYERPGKRVLEDYHT